jgi:hypothetical protein
MVTFLAPEPASPTLVLSVMNFHSCKSSGWRLVVGDNSSILYRKQQGLFSEQVNFDELWVCRVQPVMLPSFSPVKLNFDSSNPEFGQNLTVVGYGSNGSGVTTFPGMAMETSQQRVSCGGFFSDTEFCAADTVGHSGPCTGT